ncbi:MAG: carboxypeptidase-like regulatory domain-containing protein [Bryobacteraceae bacterium]
MAGERPLLFQPKFKMVIEEGLLGFPEGIREVSVTSCRSVGGIEPETGKPWVVFAKWKDSAHALLEIPQCSPSFALRGGEHVLDAIRNQIRGGAPRLVGHVYRSVPLYGHDGTVSGVRVTAQGEGVSHPAVTDGFGRYEFRSLSPGRYRMSISKPGLFADAYSYAHRDEPVDLRENSCSMRDFGMWPDGHVSGTVRDLAGRGLRGVTVEAFENVGNPVRARALQSAVTDDAGHYTIPGLPPGGYVIGVNADEDVDANEYPPTMFGDADAPTIVAVGEPGEVTGIDLLLPPKRKAIALRVRAVRGDDSPASNATVDLRNADGRKRASEVTDDNGWAELRAYAGEEYEVKVTHWRDSRSSEGSAKIKIEESSTPVVIHLRRSEEDR